MVCLSLGTTYNCGTSSFCFSHHMPDMLSENVACLHMFKTLVPNVPKKTVLVHCGISSSANSPYALRVIDMHIGDPL